MDESFRKFPNIKCENKLITEGKITLNKQTNKHMNCKYHMWIMWLLADYHNYVHVEHFRPDPESMIVSLDTRFLSSLLLSATVLDFSQQWRYNLTHAHFHFWANWEENIRWVNCSLFPCGLFVNSQDYIKSANISIMFSGSVSASCWISTSWCERRGIWWPNWQRRLIISLVRKPADSISFVCIVFPYFSAKGSN